MESLVLFGGFAVFLFLNVPIGISIGLAVIIYLITMGSMPIEYLAQNLFTSADSFPLMAIPFFILAGALMEGGGLSKRLINLADSLIGHITGGLGMVTVLTCMFFGAISGSAPATVAAVGAIMVPAMEERGYDRVFATALAAAAGVLGVIIPPSIPMVIYGLAVNASVGNMFLGGFGPGILATSALLILTYVIAKKRGYKGNAEGFSWSHVLKSFLDAIWALFVPVIILGGIYGGVFTPTEAAVVAVFYGLIVGKYVYKELTWKAVKKCLVDSSVMVGTVLIILGTGATLGKILTIEGIPDQIANGLMSLTDNKFVLLLLINIFLLIVGCVMETISALLILSPILYPIMAAFGVDIVHFGLIMVLNLAIGFITPPVGINLFVACGITDVKFEDLSKKILPFLLTLMAALLLVTYIESVTLFIPRLFGY